jgi:lipopolysaccharide transport system ATP-binding protein
MSREILVQVDGVSKKFCRSLKRSLWYGLQDIASDLNPFGPSSTQNAEPRSRERTAEVRAAELRAGEFWAVDDATFELHRGECLGLIGRNGAGKTTLLKMLNGLIRPDGGRIEMRGRVDAMIALGAGFNPVLTGRENIYVNSSVPGFSKRETHAKLDEIVVFADMADFIDSPVQSYSSGMQVRLGFAVTTALDPDVLLLDEVLAVGDAAFRAKCYARIGKLREQAAVIFVSHSMEQVSRICGKTLCMDSGRVVHYGDVARGIETYAAFNKTEPSEDNDFLSIDDVLESADIRFDVKELPAGNSTNIELRVVGKRPIGACRLNVIFYAEDGELIAEHDSRDPIGPHSTDGNISVFRRSIGPIDLLQGKYRIGINLIEGKNGLMLLWSYKRHTLETLGHTTGLARYQVRGSSVDSR